MNRRDYWNRDYADYWKKVTDEAEAGEGRDSRVEKLSGHDFKAPGIKESTSFFDKIKYDKTDKILDFGCGLGRFFPYFSDRGDYYGIDISQAMIDECKRRFPDNGDRFVVSEGESLPFEDGFFRVVVCKGVFDACYQERALLEMIRVCSVGGAILISGKNDRYFLDDEEAYVAEVNARKKGHPNYFTNVKGMLAQVTPFCEVVCERYALRRGDFGQGVFIGDIPDRFYEWEIIFRKNHNFTGRFSKFSEECSKTWREIQI